MHRPRLLILDEPTSGLDPLNQQEFYRMVAEVKADGRSVFLSSHILPEVESTCDRVGFRPPAVHTPTVNATVVSGGQTITPTQYYIPSIRVPSNGNVPMPLTSTVPAMESPSIVPSHVVVTCSGCVMTTLNAT